MATRKTAAKTGAPAKRGTKSTEPDVATSSAHSTIGGPAHPVANSKSAPDEAAEIIGRVTAR